RIDVAQVQRAYLAERDLDLLGAHDDQVELVEAALREDTQVVAVSGRRRMRELENHREPIDGVSRDVDRLRLVVALFEDRLARGPVELDALGDRIAGLVLGETIGAQSAGRDLARALLAQAAFEEEREETLRLGFAADRVIVTVSSPRVFRAAIGERGR